MSYIFHVDSGNKFDIEGKDLASIQSEIKDAGLIIGNVTLRRMVEGVLQSANGFELIASLSEEEKQETQEALDRAETDAAAALALKVNETVSVEGDTNIAGTEVGGEVVEGSAVNPIPADTGTSTASSDAIKDAVNAALVEGDAPSDAKLSSLATQALKKSASGTTLTPQAALEERKRRHNKREEMVDSARASVHGPILAAVEAGVLPGVYLSYVNPDMRWFQFPVTELADAGNPHARTNTYVDLAPIVSGGWGFSLYVAGKSFTKRQKIKEPDSESLVKAINEWLPQALAEAKAAA